MRAERELHCHSITDGIEVAKNEPKPCTGGWLNVLDDTEGKRCCFFGDDVHESTRRLGHGVRVQDCASKTPNKHLQVQKSPPLSLSALRFQHPFDTNSLNWTVSRRLKWFAAAKITCTRRLVSMPPQLCASHQPRMGNCCYYFWHTPGVLGHSQSLTGVRRPWPSEAYYVTIVQGVRSMIVFTSGGMIRGLTITQDAGIIIRCARSIPDPFGLIRTLVSTHELSELRC